LELYKPVASVDPRIPQVIFEQGCLEISRYATWNLDLEMEMRFANAV
jgi:hypothetical protein